MPNSDDEPRIGHAVSGAFRARPKDGQKDAVRWYQKCSEGNECDAFAAGRSCAHPSTAKWFRRSLSPGRGFYTFHGKNVIFYGKKCHFLWKKCHFLWEKCHFSWKKRHFFHARKISQHVRKNFIAEHFSKISSHQPSEMNGRLTRKGSYGVTKWQKKQMGSGKISSYRSESTSNTALVQHPTLLSSSIQGLRKSHPRDRGRNRHTPPSSRPFCLPRWQPSFSASIWLCF